jgi:hypothetical protein
MCGISYSFSFFPQLLQKFIDVVELNFLYLPKVFHSRIGFDSLHLLQIKLMVYLLVFLLFDVHLRHNLLILLYLCEVVPEIEYLFLVIPQHHALLHYLRLHLVFHLLDRVLVLLLQHRSDLID